MMFILGRHILAKKGFKKVFISFSGNQLIIENSPISNYDIEDVKNINDYKSYLLNKGYRMNWSVVQNLLKYWS